VVGDQGEADNAPSPLPQAQDKAECDDNLRRFGAKRQKLMLTKAVSFPHFRQRLPLRFGPTLSHNVL
jgi:hypothetical protein